MDMSQLTRISDHKWRLEPRGGMRVPAVIFGDASLIQDMDEKVLEQIANVAMLPGIVDAAYAMPDAHWGYGFPIGGVAAFDPDDGGVISAGGVGFDISCGVRMLTTALERADIETRKEVLASDLARSIPAGVGSAGKIVLDDSQMEQMLRGGGRWAVDQGYGFATDLARIEERGVMSGADPVAVSARARARQRKEMGTLGSGNHYLEVQEVAQIFDAETAAGFGLAVGDIVVSMHCGSRGMGHQIGTEFLREMALAAPAHGITLPDLELASAPLNSELGRRYLGAMRAAMNCAMANRQILTHLLREVFAHRFPDAKLSLLFDVSHNTCKEEMHSAGGGARRIFVHRKGATRAFGRGHPDLPEDISRFGQPVFIGGSMGTASVVMAGGVEGADGAFASACHGAGRRLSRHQAAKQFAGRGIIRQLAAHGILIRSPSMRGIAEEAPDAYKDVEAVVLATEKAGLARRVALVKPLICVKG